MLHDGGCYKKLATGKIPFWDAVDQCEAIGGSLISHAHDATWFDDLRRLTGMADSGGGREVWLALQIR